MSTILLHIFLRDSQLTILGCGKTQLAHTMAVIAQLPKVREKSKRCLSLLTTIQEMGGAEGKVAYIGAPLQTASRKP